MYVIRSFNYRRHAKDSPQYVREEGDLFTPEPLRGATRYQTKDMAARSAMERAMSADSRSYYLQNIVHVSELTEDERLQVITEQVK